ncbi:ATP-binding protein [Streptomyces sp. NPDC020800]|uniref:ATP-binding protein n=1 Tax=Streptomyces sp. NPDC020800 TaxID=3365092 RepID=UPI0037AB4295
MIGDSGTGTSHLLITPGTKAAMRGYRVPCTPATTPVNEPVETADEKQMAATLAHYSRAGSLCTDEPGHMKPGRRGTELLFQALTEREEKNSIAIAPVGSFRKVHMFRRTRAKRHRKPAGPAVPGPASVV